MKDLKISYINENGEETTKEYDTIMSFTDGIESGEADIPSKECKNVSAIFFENKFYTKNFSSIEELYNHCKAIMK